MPNLPPCFGFPPLSSAALGPGCVKTPVIVEIVAGAIMKRFIEGEARTQVTLLPECLDDYVTEENSVRVVDVFVDELDLGALGFEGVEPAATGRPAYHSAALLKIYI